MMWPTNLLIKSELFSPSASPLTLSSRVDLSYRRARAIADVYKLSRDDVMYTTSKFWEMHTDPILCIDGAATTLLTIQCNLAIGTIASFVGPRQDFDDIIDGMLKFEIIGQFCLTEIGHGLDAANLETTATLTLDGDFELHSPSKNAAKYMPPTIPVLGVPCVAVVFAQLVVNGECRGIRPFVVALNDGEHMCPGVVAKLLPPREGTQPVNHAITTFNRMRLPRSALLGDICASKSPRLAFLASISRVSVGTLALASVAIPGLQISANIAARYSLRRTIKGPENTDLPIFSFRTQQLPICTAISQAYVLKAAYSDAVNLFRNPMLDPRVRHGIATCLKAILVQHSQNSQLALSDRCGAQGLFAYNQMSSYHSEIRGVAIAEGDILVLSIRLISELLLGRYELPRSGNPESLLSKHEESLLSECRELVQKYGHRSDEFSRFVLPRCQAMVEAIGHRMAYDSALAHKVPQSLVDIYRCDVIKMDEAWYNENGYLTRRALSESLDTAMCAALPQVNDWIGEMEVDPYITAPIVSEDAWHSFVGSLAVYGGDRKPSVEMSA